MEVSGRMGVEVGKALRRLCYFSAGRDTVINAQHPPHFTDKEIEVQRGVKLAQDSQQSSVRVLVDPVKVSQDSTTSPHRASGSREVVALGQELNCLLLQTFCLSLQRKRGSRPPRIAKGKHTWLRRALEKQTRVKKKTHTPFSESCF